MPTAIPQHASHPSPIYKPVGLPSSYSPPSQYAMYSDDFYLHSILRYYQQGVSPGNVCPLLWDVREPPETSRRVVSHDDTIGAFHLTRPATSPSRIVLHVTCDILPELWPIEVRKVDAVTVGDVLHAIHAALMVPIRLDEWERLCEKQRHRIESVFEARWMNAPNRDECRSRGVLRVDCLLQHTLFAGLSVSPEADRSCILTLRRRPPPTSVSTILP